MMQEKLQTAVREAVISLEYEAVDFVVTYPTHATHGDYSTNVALVVAKASGETPRVVAEKIVTALEGAVPEVSHIDIAGPGFINIFLTRSFYTNTIQAITQAGVKWGTNDDWHKKTVIVEYTDPNPFKELHIGHVVPNALGESLARLFMVSNANTKRVTFQGDVGMHVAKAIYGLLDLRVDPADITSEILGKAYAHGSECFETQEAAQQEIKALNKKIYERSDESINELYDAGKQVSLAYFEKGYRVLGSAFDTNFFESDTGKIGMALVQEHVGDIFEESDGAIVFRGEPYGLHTRVFINSEGLPTYEAKDVGLVRAKYEWEPFDLAITVTGTEQTEYFKVVTKASELIHPDWAGKIELVPNGMLRLKEGKMSSRTGNVVRALDFIGEVTNAVRDRSDVTDEVAQQVAVAALKYTILKIAPGKDIVFDLKESISFEGDSGPYLQYTYARIQSVSEKATNVGVEIAFDVVPEETYVVERLLHRFPEAVKRSRDERAPHYLVTYLTELAGEFNTFYAAEKIADASDTHASYKRALAEAVGHTLKNGLWCLGIEAPEHM